MVGRQVPKSRGGRPRRRGQVSRRRAAPEARRVQLKEPVRASAPCALPSGSGRRHCWRAEPQSRQSGDGGAPRARQRPRLSLPQMSRYYLTTPISYVNSTPHIGHAYTTIAADIIVRHHRQRGDETFFLTGTDENADKVARVAEEQGLEPKEFADRIVEHWKELPRRINASID